VQGALDRPPARAGRCDVQQPRADGQRRERSDRLDDAIDACGGASHAPYDTERAPPRARGQARTQPDRVANMQRGGRCAPPRSVGMGLGISDWNRASSRAAIHPDAPTIRAIPIPSSSSSSSWSSANHRRCRRTDPGRRAAGIARWPRRPSSRSRAASGGPSRRSRGDRHDSLRRAACWSPSSTSCTGPRLLGRQLVLGVVEQRGRAVLRATRAASGRALQNPRIGWSGWP
jgi:hypothetical protein